MLGRSFSKEWSAFLRGPMKTMGWRTAVKKDGKVIDGSDPLFKITGGLVRCTIIGLVTTAFGGNVSLRLTHTTVTPAATVNLNAGAVAANSAAAGKIFTNVGATSVFTVSSGLGYVLSDPVTVQDTEFILAPGVIKCLGSAARTGNIEWYIRYFPLSSEVRVTIE